MIVEFKKSAAAKAQRAVIPVIVLYVIGALAATQIVPNWRLPSLLAKDKIAAANKALVVSQADLARAKAEAEAAQAALRAAQQAELKRKDDQLRYSQQMTAGASESIAKATPEPAVKLAVALLDRANNGLAAAIGELPADKQAEIARIVAQSLSGLTDELAKAQAALAAKDRELAVATTERASLQAQIPVLQSSLAAKDAAVVEKTAVVADKTQQVVKQAEILQVKEKEAGSLGALVGNLWKTLGLMALLALVGFGLYAWVQFRFGGIPKALAGGLADLRAKGVIPPAGEPNVFDTYLNRHEQAAISKHVEK